MSAKQALTYLPHCTGCITTAGTVFARIAMGSICDFFGPRYGERHPSFLQRLVNNLSGCCTVWHGRVQRRAANFVPCVGETGPKLAR